MQQHKQSLFGLSFSLGLCSPPSGVGEVKDDVVLDSLSDRLVEEDAEDNSTHS